MWLAAGIFLTMNRAFLRMAFPFLLTFATLAAPSAALPLNLGAEWVWQRPSGGRLTLQVRDSLHVGSKVRWTLAIREEMIVEARTVAIVQDSAGRQAWEGTPGIPWPPENWSDSTRLVWNGSTQTIRTWKDACGNRRRTLGGIEYSNPLWIDSIGPVLVPGWGVLIAWNGQPVSAPRFPQTVPTVGTKMVWEVWHRRNEIPNSTSPFGGYDTTAMFRDRPSTSSDLSHLSWEVLDTLGDSLGWVGFRIKEQMDGGEGKDRSIRLLRGLGTPNPYASGWFRSASDPVNGGFHRGVCGESPTAPPTIDDMTYDSSGRLLTSVQVRAGDLYGLRYRSTFWEATRINLLSVDGVAVRDSFPMPAAVHRSAPSPQALIDLCQAWPEARLAVLDLQGRRTIVRGADLAADLRARGAQVRVVDGLFPDGTHWRGSILVP